MSESTTHCLDQFPLEVLHVIFYYVDVPDILRLRRVSRYLNEATYYRQVWVNAYRTAECIRPPGPFPSQSTCHLEQALVTSFRIDQNLHRGVGPKSRNIPCTRKHRNAGLVFGRFLLVAFREEVCSYDLNLDKSAEPKAIYRPSQTPGYIDWLYCLSAIDAEGRPFACVVLKDVMDMERCSIYSVNVGEDSGVTLDLLYELKDANIHIHEVTLGPRVITVQVLVGNPSNWHLIALDVRSRTQLALPSFYDTLKTVKERQHSDSDFVPEHCKCISTSTHLVLAGSFSTRANGRCTFFQAFEFPTLPSSIPTSILSPSHHGTIFGVSIEVAGNILLRDAVLDSTKQDVLITLRVHTFEPSLDYEPISVYGVLRLRGTHVSTSNEIGTVRFELFGGFFHPEIALLRPSFNGMSRTIRTGERWRDQYRWNFEVLEFDVRVSDDGEHMVKPKTTTILYPRFPGVPIPSLLDVDPYSGRVACVKYSDPGGYQSGFWIFDLSHT